MSFSKREQEELCAMIDRAVYKFVGTVHPELSSSALNCIVKGYDRRKTEKKIGKFLEERKVVKFTDKLYGVFEDFQSYQTQDKNRKRKETREDEEDLNSKKSKQEAVERQSASDQQLEIGNIAVESPGQLNAAMIKEMMANAQKMITKRKAELHLVQTSAEISIITPTPTQTFQMDSVEKAKKAAELHAQIAAKLRSAGIPQVSGLNNQTSLAASQAPVAASGDETQPTPLILDEEGRTIDAKTGQTVQLTLHTPTLKANIRAIRREQFKKELKERAPEEIAESQFFDERVSHKSSQRSRRSFKFHDKGKFEQMAVKLRTKAQLERLQSEIATVARKTGIASAAKLATIQSKSLEEGEIPMIEWWDSVILPASGYEGLEECVIEGFEGITNLVEHPTQMKPPADVSTAVSISVMLTKQERKKLRRQSRMEVHKEQQEKVRLGLAAPPEPKVRLANLMRVLGNEAVQDPTKIEAHVRSQMAKRLKEHENRNAARKLSKQQRRDKKISKLKEDTSNGVHVTVYRVRHLKNPAKKFKIETNANQLFLTGIVIIHKECNVVVVEGGPKQQKKFKRLMINRIKWADDQKAEKRNDDGDDSDWINTCSLVWQGEVKTRAFGDMKFKLCPTESFAREQFRKVDVEHYWDTAYSGLVLETAENNA